MKVKEIVGFWDNRAGRIGYYAYYNAIIKGKNVILERCLRSDIDSMRGSSTET